jgi:hypothetical protein
MIKARVHGVDRLIRDLASVDDYVMQGARIGVEKAAEHLKEKIEGKFGVYQDGWPKLKLATRFKKARRGYPSGPLIETGAMKGSFKIRISKYRSSAIAATVYSDDEKLVHHVYGAPRANVPKRDPVYPTQAEEADNCHDIIMQEIEDRLR